MIKIETVDIEIFGRKYEYFRSAQSEKMFAKKAADLANKGEDEVDDSEMVDYCAKLVHQGMKDANIGKGFLWRLFNRPPSAEYLMRTLSSRDLLKIVVGTDGKGESDPNQ